MNSTWNYVPFDTLFDWCAKSNIGSRQAVEEGKYTLYIASATEQKRYNEYLHDGEALVFGTGGNPAIHYATNKFAYTNHTEAAIAKDNSINLKFYYYYFHLNKYEQLRSTFVGGGIKNSSKKKIGGLLVPIVDFTEQERIVAKIEELFSELDNNIETLKNTKKQLAVYRQAVLKAAFEGCLTEQWRKCNNCLNSWKIESITNLIQAGKHSLKAGPFGSALKKECYVPSGYKIYGQEQVIGGNEEIGDYYISEGKYQELITCKIAPKDVLISLVGTIGKVLVLSDNCKEGIINPRLIKISLDQEKMLPKFFKYYFESDYLRSLYKEKAHGATMDVLNMGMIKELPFKWCPITEQKEVISEIEARMTICDNIEKTVDTALQQGEAMRQSILKKAFEGNL